MRSLARRSLPFLIAAAWLVAACSGGSADAPGGSVAPPAIACNDVPQARCDEQAATFFRSLPNEHPTRIEVVCMAPPCTEDSGTAMMNITYADGHQLHSNPVSWSWPGGVSGGGGGRIPEHARPAVSDSASVGRTAPGRIGLCALPRSGSLRASP